jgi:hypothetical protein
MGLEGGLPLFTEVPRRRVFSETGCHDYYPVTSTHERTLSLGESEKLPFLTLYYIGQAKGRRPDKEPRLSLCSHPSSYREDLTPESRLPGIAPLKLFGK